MNESSPEKAGMAGPIETRHSGASKINLLRDRQRVVDLDAQISNRALELAVAEQQLHGAEVAGFAVDQRRLGAAQRMDPISRRIEPDGFDPPKPKIFITPRMWLEMRVTIPTSCARAPRTARS